MSVASALARGRRAAEKLMTATCTITRVDPDATRGEMDPDTLKYPEAARLTVYEGPCRIQIQSVIGGASDTDAGDRAGTAQQSELQLPVLASANVAITDIAVIDSEPNDPALVGRTFTITALHQKSHATARRLPVTEVTA
jgi:hypothetical protein